MPRLCKFWVGCSQKAFSHQVTCWVDLRKNWYISIGWVPQPVANSKPFQEEYLIILGPQHGMPAKSIFWAGLWQATLANCGGPGWNDVVACYFAQSSVSQQKGCQRRLSGYQRRGEIGECPCLDSCGNSTTQPIEGSSCRWKLAGQAYSRHISHTTYGVVRCPGNCHICPLF